MPAKRKYARVENLQELDDKFETFIHNDFIHLKEKVGEMSEDVKDLMGGVETMYEELEDECNKANTTKAMIIGTLSVLVPLAIAICVIAIA